mmetsp:Transcript_18022/g.37795  ORF Transcript_18022/g.37795 Transcript_18022/m.37795 type:complete len:203 (-) Transcript_18022:216-824(-)
MELEEPEEYELDAPPADDEEDEELEADRLGALYRKTALSAAETRRPGAAAFRFSFLRSGKSGRSGCGDDGCCCRCEYCCECGCGCRCRCCCCEGGGGGRGLRNFAEASEAAPPADAPPSNPALEYEPAPLPPPPPPPNPPPMEFPNRLPPPNCPPTRTSSSPSSTPSPPPRPSPRPIIRSIKISRATYPSGGESTTIPPFWG